MMIGMMEIPGYDGRPLVHQPELLEEHLFWLGHLYSCAHDEDTEELLFGADYEAAEVYHRELLERAEWPVFTIPLAAGHLLHVVYRAWKDDPGVDYLLHHPSWERALLLAKDDGHFMGPPPVLARVVLCRRQRTARRQHSRFTQPTSVAVARARRRQHPGQRNTPTGGSSQRRYCR
ncbi:hypothetical protein [Streptomyces sp. NPDC059757]|uniref:hypothetical protein n=1 Tax=Streptomyces sp. NPDC059757 TaxID=3346935 RepID=UPI003654EC9C